MAGTGLVDGQRARLIAAIAVLLSASAGCKAFDETRLVDAGAECLPRKPPLRPESRGDGPERVYVLRDVIIEQGRDWRSIGWDLDGACTEAPDFASECQPPIVGDGIEEDGEDGIDNVFGHDVVPFSVLLGTDLQEPFRAHEALGLGVTLVRIRGWDGQPDDAQVDVTLAPGAFGSPPDPSGGIPPLPPDGSPPPPPNYDGSDYFWADEDAFLDGDEESAKIRDDNAYVADGFLVARVPDRSSFFLTAEDRSLEILLSDTVFTARISDEGLDDVVLAGRWRGSDLLAVFQTIGFCPATVGLSRMVRLLEIQADVRAVPGSGESCDALSTGIGFTGVRAQWAGLAMAPPRISACE